MFTAVVENSGKFLCFEKQTMSSDHRCHRLLTRERCNVKCSARILFPTGGALFVSGVFGCFRCEGVRESTKKHFMSFLLSPSHWKRPNTPDTKEAPPVGKSIVADRLVQC